jgi:cyclopropane fatty-acyl-phospholipid synthase-like methyltransferase
VLEIGSGTGQHAAYFGAALQHLTWQTSDLPHCYEGIAQWLAEAGLANMLQPAALDVRARAWPLPTFDAIFSANVVHIIAPSAVESMFDGIGRHLDPAGLLVLYGPFNYGGRYTAQSNADFDTWLRERDCASGIRDFEWVDSLARGCGLGLAEDIAMPANNRCLVWRRSP